MPLIVKTHLDLRNDKCIKIYILESIEYSGGLFNTFIEIRLTYSFIQLFILSHLLTNSLSHSNKTFINMKKQSKEAFIINFLSTWSWGSHFCCDRYIRKMNTGLKALLFHVLTSTHIHAIVRQNQNNGFIFCCP